MMTVVITKQKDGLFSFETKHGKQPVTGKSIFGCNHTLGNLKRRCVKYAGGPVNFVRV